MKARCRGHQQALAARRFEYLLETGRLERDQTNIRGNALLWKARKDEFPISVSIARLDEDYPHLAVVTRENWNTQFVDLPTAEMQTDVQALAESLMARGVVMGGDAA